MSATSVHRLVVERERGQKRTRGHQDGIVKTIKGIKAISALEGYNSSFCSGSLAHLQRLSLLQTLDSHRGCVNTIAWNESGTLILSGSDDHRLVVTEPYSKRVVEDVETSHRANIFSAKFLPCTGDRRAVSCAGDGTLLYTDFDRLEETHRCQFNCHSGTTYEVIVSPGDPNSFLSCGEDGSVRWFDLRAKQKCAKPQCKEDVLICNNQPITTISLNPYLPYHLAAGSSDGCVRVYDRRMMGTRCLL